jgi:hypothetical protein
MVHLLLLNYGIDCDKESPSKEDEFYGVYKLNMVSRFGSFPYMLYKYLYANKDKSLDIENIWFHLNADNIIPRVWNPWHYLPDINRHKLELLFEKYKVNNSIKDTFFPDDYHKAIDILADVINTYEHYDPEPKYLNKTLAVI